MRRQVVALRFGSVRVGSVEGFRLYRTSAGHLSVGRMVCQV
jgi:hypothetical protein